MWNNWKKRIFVKKFKFPQIKVKAYQIQYVKFMKIKKLNWGLQSNGMTIMNDFFPEIKYINRYFFYFLFDKLHIFSFVEIL